MAKFNVQENTGITQNYCGANAFAMDWRIKLVTEVMTTFLSDKGKFYDGNSNKTIIASIRDGIKRDPLFVAKLGIYARSTFNLRSVSHVIFAELAHEVKAQEYTKDAIAKGILRVDDMTEIMAYYIKTYGKPVPNCLKKGIGKAANQFSSYQFAKYNRDGAVTLQDLFNICHPNPLTDKAAIAFKQVMTNTLPTPETWETYLSAHGNNKSSWEHLIENNSLGYMAMLRNLRNILQANVSSDHILSIVAFLTNKENVRASKQLPFRFWSAYKELSKLTSNNYAYSYSRISAPTFTGNYAHVSLILDALSKALEVSAENIDVIPGRTIIAVDTSGSMSSATSDNGTTTAREIANLMAAICAKRCENATIIHFDTTARYFRFSDDELILGQVKNMPSHGGGTDLIAPLELIAHDKLVADRVIYLSDNEMNAGFESLRSYYSSGDRKRVTMQTAWENYKTMFNPEAWIHAIDIVGYGTQQVKGARTNILGGWSERVFDFISLSEKGFDSIIEEINRIKI